MSVPITIWRFFDGRAGHRSQILGLSEAISRRCPAICHDIPITDRIRGMKSLLPGRLRSFDALSSPALLIGAGHATHIPLLAARRRFGGRIIVLMKPSLPLWMFDACLIPAADDLRRIPANVIVTEGALNRVRPSAILDPRRGLILIGGPSDHFGWSDEGVLSQVAAVIDGSPEIEWTLTTSRRTPPSFLERWSSTGLRGQMIPVDQTSPDWLPSKLQTAGTVWVTNESVSMICEALTSGAAVGIVHLNKARDSRVTRGIDSMISRRLVTPFEQWKSSSMLSRPSTKLDEASRCADLIIERLLPASTVGQPLRRLEFSGRPVTTKTLIARTEIPADGAAGQQ